MNTVNFQVVLNYEMTYENFKKTVKFPSESMYKKVWIKLLQNQNQTPNKMFSAYGEQDKPSNELDEFIDYTINVVRQEVFK
jgi:hypothetical protein